MNIGFIGLGEVAKVFSGIIQENNIVYGFDVLLQADKKVIENRFNNININYTKNLEELINNCDLILSTATTQASVRIAEDVSGFLTKDKIFLDLNSMTPDRKIQISKIISKSGIFLEGVVLGAIGATGIKTAILISGEKGEEIVNLFNNYGFKMRFYGIEIGKASKFKMIRSIFSKGVENLIIELLIAADRAEITDEIWGDINNFMESKPFEKIAENWVISHSYASKRRYYEMEQVVDTVFALGIEPIMSIATKDFFNRSVQMGIEEFFSNKPESMKDVIKFFTNKM